MAIAAAILIILWRLLFQNQTETNGKITVVVRFFRYYDRQWVYQNRKRQQGNPDKTFIVESLTYARQGLVNKLIRLRYKQSPKTLIRTHHDIHELVGNTVTSNDPEPAQ